jgi:hypothetical protein
MKNADEPTLPSACWCYVVWVGLPARLGCLGRVLNFNFEYMPLWHIRHEHHPTIEYPSVRAGGVIYFSSPVVARGPVGGGTSTASHHYYKYLSMPILLEGFLPLHEIMDGRYVL